MLITAKINREFRACYSDAILAELYGDGKTPREVATIHNGQWEYVRLSHRVWILQRALLRESRPGWLEWLARLTERALARVPGDPRSMAVVTALRANAVTPEMVAGARDVAASYTARSDDVAARAAARAAADAARAAADAAALAADSAAIHAAGATYAAIADYDAEQQAQLDDLVELLTSGEQQ